MMSPPAHEAQPQPAVVLSMLQAALASAHDAVRDDRDGNYVAAEPSYRRAVALLRTQVLKESRRYALVSVTYSCTVVSCL